MLLQQKMVRASFWNKSVKSKEQGWELGQACLVVKPPGLRPPDDQLDQAPRPPGLQTAAQPLLGDHVHIGDNSGEPRGEQPPRGRPRAPAAQPCPRHCEEVQARRLGSGRAGSGEEGRFVRTLQFFLCLTNQQVAWCVCLPGYSFCVCAFIQSLLNILYRFCTTSLFDKEVGLLMRL